MLDELNDPGMSLRVLVDVPLRGPEVAVPSQHLDVPKRPADRRYLPRSVGDEGPPPAVAGASLEAEVPVPTVEQVHDHLGRRGQRPLGTDHVGTGVWDRLAILDQGGPRLVADRVSSGPTSPAHRVLEADHSADVARYESLYTSSTIRTCASGLGSM
jgi:hypothetical protein